MKKQLEPNCINCKHFLPNQSTDGFGKPLGVCININSVFKTFYREDNNHCSQFEQENEDSNNKGS